MPRQFQVTGGDYLTLEFDRPIDGTSGRFGSSQNIERAREVWRERAEATPTQVATRYTIFTNLGAGTPKLG